MRGLISILILAASAQAQSFNVDLGDNTAAFPVPSPAYGGAAAQPGPWNPVASPFSATLASANAIATNVTLTCTSAGSFGFASGPLTGDDRNLMNDGTRLPFPGGPYTFTFAGLAAGSYTVFTYAWSPDDPAARTRVTVQGSVDPPFVVGGAWNGSPHVLNVTYVAQSALVYPGGIIRVHVEGVGGPGFINGIQIRGTPPAASFCWADGSGSACPCGNSAPAPGGCANSVSAGGAELTSMGITSISSDTLRLFTGVNPGTSALYFQGTARVQGGNGAAFGDGLRCVGGSVVRLAVVTADNQGFAEYPRAGIDPPVSVAGGNAVGDQRHYQVWYRDTSPAFCTAATFNLTNGVTAIWRL